MSKINSTTIENIANVFVERITQDGQNVKQIDVLELTRQDGAKVTGTKHAKKTFSVELLVNCDTPADFEAKVDSLKAIFDVVDGKLTVGYANGYRTYIVNTESISVNRKSNYVKYGYVTIQLMACEPPFGLESDENGNLIETEAYAIVNSAVEVLQDTASIGGTTKALPKITITYDDAGGINSFEIINSTTGQLIRIDDADINDGDIFLIDTENLEVTKNGETIDYEGVFPEFANGTNSFVISFYSESGTMVGQIQDVNTSTKPFYGAMSVAQSFTTDNVTNVIPKLALLLSKVGSPADLEVTIETHNAITNTPTGSVVPNGSITIPASDIQNSLVWVYKLLDSTPILDASTTFWIRLKCPTSDASNHYIWAYGLGTAFDGVAKKFVNNAWVELTNVDMCFKLFRNIADQINANGADESFLEEFTGTTYKDATSTASWSTGGTVTLPLGAETLDFQKTLGGNDSSISDSASNTYVSQYILPSQGGVLSKIRVRMKKVGNPTTNIWAKLYKANSNGVSDFSEWVADSSTILSASLLTTSYTDRDFNFNAKIEAGQYYTVKFFAGAGDGSNYVSFEYKFVDLNMFSIMMYYDAQYVPACGDHQMNIKEYYKPYAIASNIAKSTNVLGAGIVTIDQLDSSATNFELTLNDPLKDVSQSFTPSQSGVLDNVKFFLRKEASPTGNINLKIYNHNGTYGVNGIPQGTPLAYSENVAASSLGTSKAWVQFNFTGANRISLTSGQRYVVVCEYVNGGATNNIKFGANSGGSAHAGNYAEWSTSNGIWSPNSSVDLCFQVNVATAPDTEVYKASIVATEDNTQGVSVDYAVSVDGGSNWQNLTGSLNQDLVRQTNEVAFPSVGNDLRFKATLNGTTAKTPTIGNIYLKYKTVASLNSSLKRIAQQFTSGVDANLGRVQLNLIKVGNPGDLTVRLYSDSSDAPDQLLATQVVSAADMPTTDLGWIDAVFADNAAIVNNSKYWIVISCLNSDATNYYLIRTKRGGVYSRGIMKISTNGSTYTERINEDVLFKTFSAAPSFSADVSIKYVKRYL